MSRMDFKAPAIDVNQLPAEYAGAGEVAIEDRDQLSRAVEAIRWLSNAQATIDEAASQLSLQLQQEVDQLKQLGETTFAKQEQALREAVQTFVLKHKRALFEGDSQTLKLPHGEVCMKSSPPGITFGKLSKAKRTTKIAEAFAEGIAKLTGYAKRVGLRPWFRFKPELDLQAIKSAVENDEISEEQLAEYGLKIESTTNVTVKPYA